MRGHGAMVFAKEVRAVRPQASPLRECREEAIEPVAVIRSGATRKGRDASGHDNCSFACLGCSRVMSSGRLRRPCNEECS